jgi:murein DD-endopeptidase MepM/ murein hydrolase activator NlpD
VLHFQGKSQRNRGVNMAEDILGSKRSRRPLLLVLGFILLVLLFFGLFRVGGVPAIEIESEMAAIGKRTPFRIDISEAKRGLTHVTVEFLQGDKSTTLARKSYTQGSEFAFWGDRTFEDRLTVEAGQEALPELVGGEAKIRVIAGRAGTWLRRPDPKIEEMTLPVRLTPPTLQVTSIQTYVNQGGCEAVTYRVGEASVRDGVLAGSWWFPGYPLPGGDKQERFALFAIPYDMKQADPKLVVEDGAGNAAERSFVDRFFPKDFKSDTINISDSFLGKVIPEILSQSPDIEDLGDPLKNYLAINRDLRAKNRNALKSLAQKTKQEFLWNEAFLMMPNGKVTASFGEPRTYLYAKKVVDHQTHLGFDLAVTRRAPIPAANSGIVVFAGYFGIYGNAIVIDHGYGLQSIYGHLSSIAVSEGQEVARGEIIGRTGETGLAGGDHLHFSTLLQGLPVNPVEWWDSHWIQDRIARKLGPAFPSSE